MTVVQLQEIFAVLESFSRSTRLLAEPGLLHAAQARAFVVVQADAYFISSMVGGKGAHPTKEFTGSSGQGQVFHLSTRLFKDTPTRRGASAQRSRAQGEMRF